jgi:hypothetical protein
MQRKREKKIIKKEVFLMEIRIQPLKESRFNISLVTQNGEVLQSAKNLDIRELNVTLDTYRELINSLQ